jgi:hypothetical protein
MNLKRGNGLAPKMQKRSIAFFFRTIVSFLKRNKLLIILKFILAFTPFPLLKRKI